MIYVSEICGSYDHYGRLTDMGNRGMYWSSTNQNDGYCYFLHINEGDGWRIAGNYPSYEGGRYHAYSIAPIKRMTE